MVIYHAKNEKISPKTISFRLLSSASGASSNLNVQRANILSEALSQVHQHGWTEDAIAAAVLTLNLPPSMTGLASGGPSELVSFFMDKCNRDIDIELREKYVHAWTEEGTLISERIHQAIWCRLKMVEPYVRSGRWHEGMAIGAMPPNNTVTTAGQLSQLVTSIVDSVGLPSVGPLERAAIGGVYAATELHMLADESQGFGDTQIFLQERVRELDTMANATFSVGSGGFVSPEVVVAATAVATSLGGAIISLAQPAGRSLFSTAISTVIPHAVGFMQPPQGQASARYTKGASQQVDGASPNDYNLEDLPPFETEIASTTGSSRSSRMRKK